MNVKKILDYLEEQRGELKLDGVNVEAYKSALLSNNFQNMSEPLRNLNEAIQKTKASGVSRYEEIEARIGQFLKELSLLRRGTSL